MKLRIDPTYASGGSVSSLFDSVTYIPLETTKESLFGTVQKMIVSDRYFIIQDNSTSAILIFEKNGKFHTKISAKPMTILDFSYDKDAQQILIYKANSKVITPEMQIGMRTNPSNFFKRIKKLISLDFYDLNGEKIEVKNKEKDDLIYQLSSVNFPGGIIASNVAMAQEKMPDSTAFELNLYKNDQLYQSYFPYNTKTDIARYGNPLNAKRFTKTPIDTLVYYTRPLDYSVYQLTPHSLLKLVEFVFPMKNTIPANFFTDTISQEDRIKYLQDNPTFIVGLSGIRFIDNSWYFTINDNQWRRRSNSNLKYDLKTGQVFSFDRCTPDSSSYFLPIFDYPFSSNGFIAEDEYFLYNHISSLRMFSEMERAKDKNPNYNDVLKTYFAKGNQKDNPVIVQLKPKASQ